MEKKLFGNICFTRLVKALMLSYFLTMLMLLGLSFGLYKFDLSEKTVRIGILAVYIISTFSGVISLDVPTENCVPSKKADSDSAFTTI